MEKLIRFDWAIKSLLRNKANFDILEGFLCAVLNDDVKVLNLLESESNQDDERDKFNRVDLLVENTEKELIIIEVQIESELDFFQRLVFGTAKLIVDNMQSGQAYEKVRKVISISITYFNLGIGEDYVYHGSTSFVGIHENDLLKLTTNQRKRFGFQKVQTIFPEYYIIRVGKFEDEVKNALDEWVYMLKNSEVKPEFNAKHIQDASERLRVMNMDPRERDAYERFMDNRSYQASMEMSFQEIGRQQEREAIVQNALQMGLPIEEIAKLTSLSLEEINQIKRRNRD